MNLFYLIEWMSASLIYPYHYIRIINAMKAHIIIILATLLITASPIFIAMKSQSTRCMVEFIVGAGQVDTVKIKILFPQIPNEVSGEHFYLTLRNTQTNKTSEQPMRPGSRYIKEQQFQSNVIYEICISFRTQRDIEAVIQYETQSVYNYQHEIVKVPETLLTKKDFKQAFISASYIKNTIDDYIQEHKSRKTIEYKQFGVIDQVDRRVTVMCAIELIVLSAASLYQFVSLKNYLSTKQYI